MTHVVTSVGVTMKEMKKKHEYPQYPVLPTVIVYYIILHYKGLQNSSPKIYRLCSLLFL